MTRKADCQSDLVRVGLAPRGLSREQAAAYVGVSPNFFDGMVKDGRMPKPKHVGMRNIWDRARLDTAFERLPDAAGESGTHEIRFAL